MTEKKKYLIIGNSAGGIGAAEAIREIDRSSSISIISEEPYPAYSRPLISEHLAEGYPLEKMLFRPQEFYRQNDITVFLGRKVIDLSPEEYYVELENGEKIYWDKLLLATGGSPIIPEIKRINLKGIFTFTTLDDARAIKEYLGNFPGKQIRAVVIGGGLIGVSVTEALVKLGIEVNIVELKDRILNLILDEETSSLEETTLRQAGVNIVTEQTVSEITGSPTGETSSVVLSDGKDIPCEIVILAIGVKPRIELALNSGIKTNRGIIADRYMTTSHPDIYTCGDAAEAFDFIYGENRLLPIWPSAYLGGRVAGFNIAGIPTKYPGGTAMNSMKYFGINICSAGIVTPPDESYEVVKSQNNHLYKKVVIKDGLIAGIVFCGDIEKSGIVYNLMKEKTNVESFKHNLVNEDFGLLSLPEEIWRPKFAIPPSILASSVTSIEQPEEVLAGEY